MKKKGPPPEIINMAVDRLKAVADPARVTMLLRLRREECNVTTLVDELGIAQASVSKHLSILRREGFVSVRRLGAQAIYRIKDETVFDVLRIICEGIHRDQADIASAIGLKAPNYEI